MQAAEKSREEDTKSKKGVRTKKLTPEAKANEGTKKRAIIVPESIKIAGKSIK